MADQLDELFNYTAQQQGGYATSKTPDVLRGVSQPIKIEDYIRQNQLTPQTTLKNTQTNIPSQTKSIDQLDFMFEEAATQQQPYTGPIEEGSPLSFGQRAKTSFGDTEGIKTYLRTT